MNLLGGAFVASAPDPSAAREYARIKRGVLAGDTTVLAEYGGAQAALKRAIELQQAAQDRFSEIEIDGYATRQATRLLGTNYGCG